MPTPEQLTKFAQELAQAETARELRKGTLEADDAASFETRRFKEITEQQQAAFDASGKPRPGFLQSVKAIAELPSINDIAEHTTPPVITTCATSSRPDDAEDFADRWAALNEKLTRDEQDLLMTTLSGAEVNHALLYMVVSFVGGLLAGWAACALLS